MSDDGVPNLGPGGQEYHDVTWRDGFLGVDLMPLPVRRADSHRGGFDQAPDAQGDEQRLPLHGVGPARAEGVQRDCQVGCRIGLAAGAQWT